MKTKIYILTALMLLSVHCLFANGHILPESDGYEPITIHAAWIISLAPETPKEASFDDISLVENLILLGNLTPVTPLEADFEDAIPENTLDLSSLKPILPVEADFEIQ